MNESILGVILPMKLLLRGLCLMTIFTVSSPAHSALFNFHGTSIQSSWEDLGQDQQIQVGWPQVHFRDTTISLNKLCQISGNEFRTIAPVQVCLQTSVHRYEVSGNSGLEAPVTYRAIKASDKTNGEIVERNECDKLGSVYLYTFRSWTYDACTSVASSSSFGNEQGQSTICTGYAPFTINYPTELNVRIYRKIGAFPAITQYSLMGTKSYRVPECK
jgi:hypothetical protein